MAKTKEELIYDIENELVDPTTNKITGERVKARLLDMVDAMSESTGSGGQLSYWNISDGVAAAEFAMVCALCKVVTTDSGTLVLPLGMAEMYISYMGATLQALAFDFSQRLTNPETGELVTIGEILTSETLMSAGLTEITEEEFYTI